MFSTPTRTQYQHAGAFWLVAILLLTAAFALPSSAYAQGNYVYVNNQSAANSISAYSVSVKGALSPVPGSPFLTGGRGANVNCYGLDRIVISAPNNVLFVTNTLDLTISAFQINPATGGLTAVPGSPFASGLTLDSCSGMSLAPTPDGKFLMASSNGQIQTFAIAANGALSLIATTPNCCTPMVSMKISPNGQFLATSNETSVSVFTITAGTGVLTPVLGSPFPRTGAATVGGLDFNSCGNNLLYGGEATSTSNITDAWTVGATGALSAVPGTPFSSPSGTDSNVVLVTPDNTRLFESNQFSNSVNSFTLNANGSLTTVGKYGGVGFLHVPVGLATDLSGAFLYVADDPFGIAVLRINTDGSLSNLSDTAIANPGEIQGLAAYPPRSCTSADLAISITASPNPVFANSNLTYTITVTNNGPDAPAFTVADTLPSTLSFVSCTATGGGVCNGTANARTVSFPALANGASVTATLVGKVSGTVVNNSLITNTASISNSSAVDPNRANNSASATVTALQQFATTLTVPTATGPYGGTALFTATLRKKSDNSPIAGETINFFLNRGAVGVAITDATGLASLSVPLGTIKVGTYAGAVIASFTGDTSFAASSGTASLVVTKAVLTVTANNASRLYGDPNPAFSYTFSGFVNGDTAAVVSGTASCSTTATPTSPVGSYPITCTQGTLAATNYVFAFVAGSLTVNPAPLTVTVNNASRAYGSVNPTFTGTITGLKNSDPITATYTTTATPASPVGTYPITAVLADPNNLLGNYTVTNNPGTLTITPAALTVIPNNAARLYGDPNPALSGIIVGIQNGDNITATYATTATVTSPVGNYPITATLVDPTNKLSNYVVTLNSGTLAVSPAPLTVTVADATRPYGSANPVFTGTIAGIKNGDNITATYSTTATTASPLGTYSITATLVDPTAKLGNYTVTNNPGTLTITSAQLTVTVADATRVYGDPNPAFTVSFSGFVNGDTAAVVSGTQSCTSAAPTSAIGTYPIVCTQGTLAATSYVFVFVNGTLTVTPAPLTVTAANATRLYGDANPAFTGTITGIKNGDNITVTYSTTATVTSLIGTYPIVPALVDPTNKIGNYTVTSNNATLTVTQAPLVITAANLSRAYAAANPALTGTITGVRNGDPITVTFATTAIQTSPAGIYPITPTLNDPAGKLSNYTVTINNGTLTVTAVPLIVTVANATRAYSAPNPAFTGIITGLQNGDNISAIYSTTATATSPAGTYPITATLVDPNNALGSYVVTINPGTLTITSAVLTVTAANTSRFYGDPNPVLTGTITGIANGDNITATYASAATPASLVGAYPIVPTVSDNGTGALANYTVVINNGILAVNPAPLTVTAANATRVYGDPNPAFTGLIAGIKNGDNITALFASAADPTSPAGTYAILATLIDPTSKLANYTVTSINGTLTVTPAPLTVTAANASRLFGTPNPPFSGIITGLKNGDIITASYSTTAISTSAVGTYPIVAALIDPAGKLGNYAVTSNNGTLTVNAAPTANFVFVNNQAAAGNSISGYSVAANGTLTALAGSPAATGGLGANAACSSVNRVALSAGNNLLFVSNGGDQTISAFSIDPASGALTAAAGSPFASGLTLDACGGISVAATPDGRFLMASSNGQIKTFSIGASGALSAVSTTANPVVPNASMKISANGQFLAVSNGASVSLYTLNADGSLAAVTGSPFAETGTGTLAGLDFNSTSGLLFGAEASGASSLADAWTVGGNGALAAITGSPFSLGAVNSNVVLLSPNDAFLFASNQGSSSVSSYGVNAGSLASIGSFGSAASLHAPVGMATDRSGSLLYVADDTFGVAVFRIAGAGSLTQLGDVAIAGAGQVQDLVAYPPRMASNADLSVAISASSPNVVAGQNVTYTISVTNNGADPAAATVTDSLPTGFSVVSCSATGNGACIGNSAAANFYLLQSGETQTVTLVASTSLSIANGTVTTNNVSVSNSSAVDANAANNSASATVTVAQPASTTLAVAAASGTYGGSATLSATLTTAGGPLSGKTVSFTLNGSPAGSAVTDATGLASVSASVAGIAAGSYPGAVAASFAGDANNTATSGSATLTVSAAVLTVTSTDATRIYGDPNPAFSFAITGFVNGDTVAVVSGSPACTSADPTAAVATYPINCTTGTLTAANYTFTFVSGNLTVTPAALSVAAANSTRLYGDPNPAFTGTITGIKNGDNITASYSSTATAASPVGTYPITPALVDPTGKLGNYTVTSTNGTLTVTPAPLSVAAANATRFYGDPNPAFTGTITGIKNADNITATYSSVADATSLVGTYPIVPALVDPTGKLSNYTVTATNGVLTVSPAPLVVTAANASRLYGDPNPAFTGSISGVKNGDTFSLSFSSVADATSAVGTYPIVPALTDPNNKLPNYAVTINNGTLTVNPAPLTVSAANASRAYGSADPAFTGAITGIKNGDNITATFASAATATSNVGSYPIVPTLVDPAAKLGNYTVTSTNGTLTITQAPLTVAANNASRVYGDPNPTFTGTITGLVNGDNITFSATSADPTAAVGTYPIVPVLVDPTGKLPNYSVTSTNGTLTVSQAPLSVVAANSTRAYGDPNNLSGTLTGVKNGDNITAAYSTTATATSAPGTYPITASLLDPTSKLGNYSVTITNATLTVTPATLTVSAANASMVFGDPVPALSGTIAGIKNGDNITATYSTTATSASPAGTYPIVPAASDNGTGTLANYTIVVNNGTLTISPAPLVVTATNASRLYGDPNPAFTGTITGLKNGNTIGATFSAAADPTSAVGNYAIIPTLSDPNNQLSNYTVTINNGVLTVNPAPLSVTAANAGRLYGDPNPAFTGTIAGIKNADNITATYASATDATTTVGTYPIVPTLVDPTNKLANYVVTSTNGTLTISPAPLTIQANDATAPVGGPFPTFTGTITGLKNTDVVTASYSTTAGATSPAGTYPIIPAADANPVLVNYAVTLINGTLTLQ